MAIDKMMSDAILGTFRNMSQEIKDKEYTGEDVDKMNAALARMEQLAEELSDLNEFNGLMMQENLYMKFSDHYGRALSNAQKGQYQLQGDVYDEKADQQLMKQTLDAYKQAIKTLRDTKKESVKTHGEKASKVFFNDDALVKPIEDVIKLGESGISYPEFLRRMIELNMDKAMGGATVSRDAQIYSIDFYSAGKINPYYEERENAYLKLFDELAAKSPVGAISILKYNLGNEVINVGIDPKIKKWDSVKHYWESVLDGLSWWSLAHMSFAHTLEPWSMAKDPRASVRESIECDPGEIQIKLQQLKKYHGLSFHDIFKHESFIWEVTYNHLWYSQAYVEFMIEEVFPTCFPGKRMSPEQTAKMEKLYKEDLYRNPETSKVLERYRVNHDKYFGEGSFYEKNSRPEPFSGKSTPWDLGSFKY